MRMRMLVGRCCLAFAFMLILSQDALAQTRVFISGFATQEIVRYDVATDTTLVIHPLVDCDCASQLFRPEDIAVGPDGKVYVCDSQANKIFRMNQDGSQFEAVYIAPLFTEGETVDVLRGPEGPSFIGTDLYVNTRPVPNGDSGIWKITGIAAVPFGSVTPAPVPVLTAAQTGTTSGEGTAFKSNGNLLIVDRSGHRVLESAPPYSSVLATPAIAPANLTDPIGIAVNSTGQIFVADINVVGETVTNVIKRYSATGVFEASVATFADRAWFLELDLSGALYVATSDNFGSSGTGNLWRVDGAGGATPSMTQLTNISETEGPFLSGAVGLAVSTIPAVPIVGVVGSGPKTYSPTVKTQTFERNPGAGEGVYAKLTFLGQVLTTFQLEVFFVTVTQAAENTRLIGNPDIFTGNTCIASTTPSDVTGHCIRYTFRKAGGGVPHQGADFTGNFRVELAFHADQGTIGSFDIAHAITGDPSQVESPIDLYDEKLAATLSMSSCNCVGVAETDGFSDMLPITELVSIPPGFFTGPLSPIVDGQSVIQSGRALPVRFSLTNGEGGPAITDAIAVLGVKKLPEVPTEDTLDDFVEILVDVRGATTSNQFTYTGGGIYQLVVDTKGWPAGLYRATISFKKNEATGNGPYWYPELFDFAVKKK